MNINTKVTAHISKNGEYLTVYSVEHSTHPLGCGEQIN